MSEQKEKNMPEEKLPEAKLPESAPVSEGEALTALADAILAIDEPEEIADALLALWTELRLEGPVQPEWPHYGKLKGRKAEEYHCHLNKGRPTYVAVWKVLDKQIRLMEINYVGTHENAPY